MPRKSKGTRTNAKTKPAALPVKFEPGFVARLDGRTLVSRALKANYEAIADDLGGEGDLSHLKRSLIERTVFLESVLGQIEHELATARQRAPDDKEGAKVAGELVGRWIQAVNSFQGLAKVLGIERKMQTRPWIEQPTQHNGNGSSEGNGEKHE